MQTGKMNVRRRILLRMFGRPEGALGSIGGLIMARANRLVAQQVIDLLDVRSSDRVLEIGFGPGVAIALLAARIRKGAIAGVDPSAAMLAQAQARNAAAVASGKVDLRLGEAERLPFADAAFDRALAINSMQLWPNVGAGLREIHRVLRRDGKLALGFTLYSGQQRSGVPEALFAAGFTDVRTAQGEAFFCTTASKP
jgi:ubiquinone/menaquinone biosynthesis C-methylase UbiE